MWLDTCFSSPTHWGQVQSTNTPVFPPSSFLLLSFAWFYILFFTGQVLLSTVSWCSACTSVSEGVFLIYPWREMYSTPTYCSAIFISLNLNFLICGFFLFKIQVPGKEHLASCPSLARSWGGLDLFSHYIYIQRKLRVLWQKRNQCWESNKLQAKQIMKIHWHSVNCGGALPSRLFYFSPTFKMISFLWTAHLQY